MSKYHDDDDWEESLEERVSRLEELVYHLKERVLELESREWDYL